MITEFLSFFRPFFKPLFQKTIIAFATGAKTLLRDMFRIFKHTTLGQYLKVSSRRVGFYESSYRS